MDRTRMEIEVARSGIRKQPPEPSRQASQSSQSSSSDQPSPSPRYDYKHSSPPITASLQTTHNHLQARRRREIAAAIANVDAAFQPGRSAGGANTSSTGRSGGGGSTRQYAQQLDLDDLSGVGSVFDGVNEGMSANL